MSRRPISVQNSQIKHAVVAVYKTATENSFIFRFCCSRMILIFLFQSMSAETCLCVCVGVFVYSCQRLCECACDQEEAVFSAKPITGRAAPQLCPDSPFSSAEMTTFKWICVDVLT